MLRKMTIFIQRRKGALFTRDFFTDFILYIVKSNLTNDFSF